MQEVRPKQGMVIEKVCQGLGGSDGADQYGHEQPKYTRRVGPKSFSATLMKLRADKRVSFQSSNPCSGV